MAYLIVERPDARPQKIDLPGTRTIGRSKEAGIWLPDKRLSREHCRVEQRSDGWFIVDLGSSNGTLIDDHRIRERRLEDRQRVLVGDTWLEFRSGKLIGRPSDPIAAAQQGSGKPIEPSANHGSTLLGTKFASRVLPNENPDDSKVSSKPLAFSRPPATPIVKGNGAAKPPAAPTSEESNWFKSLVGRLRGG